MLADDSLVADLNERFRHKRGTTDVLSFPTEDPAHLGDVIISVEQARRQAPGDDLEAELVRLLVHGWCHLHGHDHLRATDARRMRQAEHALLALFGIDSALGEQGR